MSFSLFGEEGYSNPILDNKFFFCVKNPALINAVVSILDPQDKQEWMLRINSLSMTDLYMSNSERQAVLDEEFGDPFEKGFRIAFTVQKIVDKFAEVYGEEDEEDEE